MERVLERLLLPASVAFFFMAVFFIVRTAAFRILLRWTEKTGTRTGDIIARAFRIPSIYWCIAIGLHIGISFSELPEKYVASLSKTIHAIVIFSITIVTANLADNVVRHYVQGSDLPIPSTGLAYGILKGAIIAVGLLVILAVLGVSIAPLITALGVGGLAVALALQDTLSNLFAGIHILIEKAVRVGDVIRLETGQEGHVEDITWRTTRIRMPSNNMVVIPNNKLSQSVVTNYSLPERRLAVTVQFGVVRSSDPDFIERLLLEEVRTAADEVPFILSDPPPTASLSPGFGESSLEFTLVFHARDYNDQGQAQAEVRKRVVRRFQREGVEMSCPQRIIRIRDGKTEARL